MSLAWKVNRDALSYLDSHDARFFWRALYRLIKAGKPLPQSYLDELAAMAGIIMSAKSGEGLLAALGLAGKDGQHMGPKHSASYAKRFVLAAEVDMVHEAMQSVTTKKVPRTEAIRAVAKARGLSEGTVKEVYYKMRNQARAEAHEARQASARLQDVWK